MNALAPLKTSVNLFGYIVRCNPLNPHLKPCAINTANPILQVKKTDPKNQISWIKTPHPIGRPSVKRRSDLQWAKEKDCKTVRWKNRCMKLLCFRTRWLKLTIPVLSMKPELTLPGLLVFPKNNYYTTRLCLQRADSINSLRSLLGEQLFPGELRSRKFQATIQKIPSQWGNSEVNRSHSQSGWGASGYDSGNLGTVLIHLCRGCSGASRGDEQEVGRKKWINCSPLTDLRALQRKWKTTPGRCPGHRAQSKL